MNARSLKTVSNSVNKLVEFANIVAMYDSKITAVTETWLTSSVQDGEILSPQFCIHRKDRCSTLPDTRGGGVLLAVDNSLPSRRRKDLEPPCELLVCEIAPYASQKIAILLCYRPPNSDLRDFIHHLECTLFRVHREFTIICMLGDFNLPLIDWHNTDNVFSNNVFRDFVVLTQMYHLSQVNHVASNVHNNFLDLIFVNSNIVHDISGHSDFPSDHVVLHFGLQMQRRPRNGPERVVFNYKGANYDLLFSELQAASLLDVIMQCHDVDTMWLAWYNAVMSVIESVVPKVIIRNSSQPPWFDGQVRHAIKCKRTAWRRAKRCDSEETWAQYRAERDSTKRLLKKKHGDFINSLGVTCKENPKRFWSFFKGKTNSKTLPDTLYCEGSETRDPSAKATLFNDYFVSVFTNDSVSHSVSHETNVNVISDPVFTVDEVSCILSKLNTNKACAPNDISPVILSKCAHILAPSLCAMFNVSILCHTVPSDWKKTSVVPVFKKGDKHDVKNYRPISLLSVVSKVMERCMFNFLYPLVAPQIHHLQHGFMKHKSCTTQLLKVYNFIGSILDKGGQIDILFLDFSKAFDSVSHQLLLYKLRHFYSIEGNTLKWIEDYLSDRTQRVLVEGATSDFKNVTSGVPQGSILGPLLFLLYINDMASVGTACTLALFADDSKCFKSIVNLNDCYTLQNDLDKLYNWSRTWKMDFNPTKCKVLSIHRSRNPIIFYYRMNDVVLEHVSTFKDLGVIIDETLSFTAHIDSILNKCSKVCGMIKRSVGFSAPVNVKLQLYKTLCRSIMDFSSQLWSPQSKMLIIKTESIQRSMTKYILNDFISSYRDRCVELELLPLSYQSGTHPKLSR